MEIRERILEAAAAVFAEVGFRGATTRRIATEAEVNEVTLFRHFGSKERLLGEAIHAANSKPPGSPLPDRPTKPRSELVAWAREQMVRLRVNRSLIRTCMAEVAERPGMVARPGGQTTMAATQLRTYLVQLKAHGFTTVRFDPATAAPMLLGALFADAMGRDVMPDMYPNDPDAAIRTYVDLFLRGLGVATPSKRRAKEPV
jgi:AcrR family transcriptional regulator